MDENQVYGAALTDETKIVLTQNQVYGVSRKILATEELISL